MFETVKKILFALLLTYFAIAAYHNVRTEVRYWLGYTTCSEK